MNYSDNTSSVCAPCSGTTAREENLQEMIARSADLAMGILKITESIRGDLFGEWPTEERAPGEVRCFTDVLRIQLAISEEAASQLKFIAERLGV